jgi:hypothetical protein
LAPAGLERDIASPLQYPGGAMKTVKGNATLRSVPLPLPSAGSLILCGMYVFSYSFLA